MNTGNYRAEKKEGNNNYSQLLKSIYYQALQDKEPKQKLEESTLENIKIIAEKCFQQKAVYTVLITLSIYKIFHPQQDIRNHQTQIKNGFSGRTIDTQYITPTLKELDLLSMAEK
ncbi:hypothetical protein [Cyanobacterium sp. Dongsha4]|uniref:hypothetical protein n=1 Tax=Cyanobacterium sp. DS4 TaxID=2878255 RepID=UPI002E81E333|nr:hypothetical protein [Cyanobacterium sp. Dongsha4]WVL01620.1 hypothetical protein Dongsha4_05380 [Cyanobacterium sp. Dongsha4]